jgi:Anti-sigma-K factor rskA
VDDDDELAQQLARALDTGPAAPPPERVAALRAEVESARTPAAGPARQRGGAWLAAAAAVLAVLGGVAVARSIVDDDTTAEAVEYDGPMVGPAGEPTAAELRVVATGTGRIVELDTDVLPILPTGEFYELWFVGRGDGPGSPNRISAGTFHPDPDGRSDVQFLAAVNPELFPVVEVTAEPGDGEPRSTGPVVLRATIS